MLFIEFEANLHDGLNMIRYRNVDVPDNWHSLYVDIETLNLLLNYFGVVSNKTYDNKINCDNGTTGRTIRVDYCGTNVELICGNKASFNLALLEMDCSPISTYWVNSPDIIKDGPGDIFYDPESA